MCQKCLYLGNVLLRSSFMKTWLPFWTALISVLCPVSCLLQFFFFFTEDQKKTAHKQEDTDFNYILHSDITSTNTIWSSFTCFVTGTTLTRGDMITSLCCSHVDLPWVFSQFGQWYMSISGASSSSTPTQLREEKHRPLLLLMRVTHFPKRLVGCWFFQHVFHTAP